MTCWVLEEGVEVVEDDVGDAADAAGDDSAFLMYALAGARIGPGVLAICCTMRVAGCLRRLRRFLQTTQAQAININTTINVAITPAAAITPPDKLRTLPPRF
jgi:hypothetical protein